MPSISPQCARYVPPPPTSENLDFIDLPVIDLAKAQTPEGRAEIYPQVRDAFQTYGFVYGINHGYTPAQRDRIFDISDVPFTTVSPEELKDYAADIEKAGHYQGYKSRRFWKIDSESATADQIEMYSINMDVNKREHPPTLQPFLPEIDAFAQLNHFNILHPILRLLALSLELPEEAFVDLHKFRAAGQTAISFMKYHARSIEEEEKTKDVWMKGHTDIGSISILWSQPVGGLQVMSEGKWKWVRHIDNAVVIDTGDTMEFLSGGFFKPTVHRVVQPPRDQRPTNRLGVFYFGMPDDSVRLVPLAQSPVLERVGIERRFEDADAPTMDAWRTARTRSYGLVDLKKSEEKGVEEEIVTGIVVKHYN
ncbi:hypothetical protein JAAARDRAFT_625236 [Jaapia argillacea MUCL 33604]|uniref:Fe2OG dioxygenase domain-containing protein n=1 Tax=Jaapia argillacea MUCL 33604 TaxID=933084 RepID=A0A067Q7U1_9AGAM|nr:hypothetical protein JAAARDRAFT_625236 [Jaapia argillacea MUCL 33604]